MNRAEVVHETNDLIFKCFKAEDMTDEYFSWFYDKDVTKFNSHGLFPYSKEQQVSFLESIDRRERIVFAVYTHGGTQVGNVDLASFDWINRSAELAIVIGEKDAWGRGLGTQMCKFVLSHGFDKLNLNRIWTGTADTNLAMKSLAKKIGMSLEGVFKEGMFLNGEYIDVHSFGILRSDNVKKESFSNEEVLELIKGLREDNNYLWMDLTKVSCDNPEGLKTLKKIILDIYPGLYNCTLNNDTVDNILAAIQQHREVNNKYWMDILKKGMEIAEGREIIRKITEHDKEISRLLEGI